jgi:Transglycosylase SLT domain
MRRIGFLVLALVLCEAAPVVAKKRSVGTPRFPATISEQLMRDLVATAVVAPNTATGRNAAQRWGAATVDEQASSIRAVIQALIGTRPPLDLAASILAIARIESGWNPAARNPTSSACGLFQFVRGTWESYGGSHDSCDDPALNACLGVEHLTSLYRSHVRPQIEPLSILGTESDRLEWTYRLLYAYHYHGEDAPEADDGGAPVARSAADWGLPQLKSFFSILKRATAPPRRPRMLQRARNHAAPTKRAARASAKQRRS